MPGVITGARLQKTQSDITLKYKNGTNIIGKAHYLGTYDIGDNSARPVAKDWKLIEASGIQGKVDDELLDYIAEETYHLSGPI